jgi:predicted NBD/HSP70 family sugar kinase
MHTTIDFEPRGIALTEPDRPMDDDLSAATPRERNRLRIVDALRSHGSASRSELAHSTGLSRSTVSSLVADLQARGLVADAPSPGRRPARTGRGRPPELLRLHAAAGAAVALRVDQRSLDVAVADLSSTILAERRFALPARADIATAVEVAADAVGTALADAGLDRGKIRGAALVAPASAESSLAGVHAGATLSGRLGIPVRVEDEANLAALGELAFGAASGFSDIVCVSLSSRIGAGIIIGGRLHRGSTGAAGELGHVEVRPDGLLCRCGNRGCLDTIASVDAVLELLRPVHGPGLALTGALELVARGDTGARRVVTDAGRAVGRMLAGACNLLNPQAIVVGGELSAAGEPLLTGIRETIERYAHADISSAVEIIPGTLGTRASLLGALTSVIGEPVAPAALAAAS